MSFTQYYLILLIILQLQFQLHFASKLLFNRLFCSALVILTLGTSAVCTFWPCGVQLICTWYPFPYFLWIQCIVLASAWYSFPQVGWNGLWLVSATIAEFILTNLFSVVEPLVNRFWPLAVRFLFSLCLAGVHWALGARLCRSFVVLLLLNCKVVNHFSPIDPFCNRNNNTVFIYKCMLHSFNLSFSTYLCNNVKIVWARYSACWSTSDVVSNFRDDLGIMSVLAYPVLKVYYWMGFW